MRYTNEWYDLHNWSMAQLEDNKWLGWLYNAEMATCDHVLDCDSDVGPDHGIESLHCKKCGWSEDIIYY